VTVRTDGDLGAQLPHFESLAVRPPEHGRLRRLFERWEFRSFLKDLEADAPPDREAGPAAPSPQPQARAEAARPPYEMVVTAAQLEHWIARINAAPLVALDTETTSLDPMAAKLVGLSLAVTGEHGIAACYIPLSHRYAGVPDSCRSMTPCSACGRGCRANSTRRSAST
jgi:DNA polymerase I